MTGPYVVALRFDSLYVFVLLPVNKLHSTRNIPTNQINATVDSEAHVRTDSEQGNRHNTHMHEHTMNTSIQLINGNMK